MASIDRDIRWLPGFSGATLLFFLFLYLPLIILVVFSFNATRSATVWAGFSIDWYAKAFSNDDILDAAKNSLIVAVAATCFATSFATMAAISLTRNTRIQGKTMFRGILLLPLMIPEIVTAIATLSFFAAIGLQLGLGNIIIAHTVFCIPFAYLPIQARLAGLDGSLETAARDLYAGKWDSLRLVTIPLLMPGIISGAMLAFIVSLDDFIITLMVADAGSTTLPIYIYSLVRLGITPEVNAISTVLLGLSALGALVSDRISKRK